MIEILSSMHLQCTIDTDQALRIGKVEIVLQFTAMKIVC